MALNAQNHSLSNANASRFLLSLLFSMFAVVCSFGQQSAQPATAPANVDQFVGTWAAVHNETQYFVLELRKENGTLTGSIRVCTFTMSGEGEHPDVTITNDKLSEAFPVRNLAISEKSLTFDWKDPDGDDNHIQFERTTDNSARLTWRDLPSDAKMPVFLLTRQATKTS